MRQESTFSCHTGHLSGFPITLTPTKFEGDPEDICYICGKFPTNLTFMQEKDGNIVIRKSCGSGHGGRDKMRKIAVFTLSPLLYELLKRIPFIRWCVLGEKNNLLYEN